eukprot:7389258-Prymnesium_polylepis.1
MPGPVATSVVTAVMQSSMYLLPPDALLPTCFKSAHSVDDSGRQSVAHALAQQPLPRQRLCARLAARGAASSALQKSIPAGRGEVVAQLRRRIAPHGPGHALPPNRRLARFVLPRQRPPPRGLR